MMSSSGFDGVDPARRQQITELFRINRQVVPEYMQRDPGWEGTSQNQLAAQRPQAGRLHQNDFKVASKLAVDITGNVATYLGDQSPVERASSFYEAMA
jgi:hypothetical protein